VEPRRQHERRLHSRCRGLSRRRCQSPLRRWTGIEWGIGLGFRILGMGRLPLKHSTILQNGSN
jgi:hypothetical protein